MQHANGSLVAKYWNAMAPGLLNFDLKVHLSENVMPISDLSDAQLDNLEANYRKANKTDGGIYPLSDILLEKLRRRPTAFGVVEVARKILELAKTSDDGLLTYGDIWKAFNPNTPWKANYSRRVVADSLYRVIHYCVTNHLPVLTVLVVRGSSRKLSPQAIQNIYDECRALGVDVGLEPKAFVEKQVALTRAIKVQCLPKAS
jgi:hypothetical protein